MTSYILVAVIIFAFSISIKVMMKREFSINSRSDKYLKMNEQLFVGSMILLLIGTTFVASFFVGIIPLTFFKHSNVSLCNEIFFQLSNLVTHGAVIMCAIGMSQTIGAGMGCFAPQEKRGRNNYSSISPG